MCSCRYISELRQVIYVDEAVQKELAALRREVARLRNENFQLRRKQRW